MIKSFVHLELESFSQLLKFVHGSLLELFHILMLPLKLILHIVSESTELQTFISPLFIDFLMQFVFFII
jgi:hypothetical protein